MIPETYCDKKVVAWWSWAPHAAINGAVLVENGEYGWIFVPADAWDLHKVHTLGDLNNLYRLARGDYGPPEWIADGYGCSFSMGDRPVYVPTKAARREPIIPPELPANLRIKPAVKPLTFSNGSCYFCGTRDCSHLKETK